MYQLMFAIITPALIIGAIAERMKFSAIFLFITLWMFVVYFPQAHMIWGIDGMMNGVCNPDAKIHAIDFAGGTVVHMTSGWSALILCLILGKRLGFGKENFSPAQHDLLHGRHRHALGRLVRVQRRQRRGRRRHRRQRLHHHDPRHRRGLLRLADGGMDLPRQAQRPRFLFRRGGGLGRHHARPADLSRPRGAVIIGVAAGLIPWFFCYKVKAGSATTTRWTPSASTPSAAPRGAADRGAGPQCRQRQPGHQLKIVCDRFRLCNRWFSSNSKPSASLCAGHRRHDCDCLHRQGHGRAFVQSEEVETIGLDLAEHGEEGYHGLIQRAVAPIIVDERRS